MRGVFSDTAMRAVVIVLLAPTSDELMIPLQRLLWFGGGLESLGWLQIALLPEIISGERTSRHLLYVRECRPNDAAIGGIKNDHDALNSRCSHGGIRRKSLEDGRGKIELRGGPGFLRVLRDGLHGINLDRLSL